jgi:hypothetical protein
MELTKQGDLLRGEPSSGHPETIAKTIFGNPHLVSILEEGHIYCNAGPNHQTTVTLMSTCAQRIILTVTPDFTHPCISSSFLAHLIPEFTIYLTSTGPPQPSDRL